MTLRWLIATLHLLALGIGLGAVWARARRLRGSLDPAGLRQLFYADNLWALAAVIWIATGVARAFGGLEKGTPYYLGNAWFHAKMGALLLVLVLEVPPMIGLIRWRRAVRRGEPLSPGRAGAWARTSRIQALLVVVMTGLAAAMARGVS